MPHLLRTSALVNWRRIYVTVKFANIGKDNYIKYLKFIYTMKISVLYSLVDLGQPEDLLIKRL